MWHSWPLSCSGWLSIGQQLAGNALDLVALGGLLQNDHEFVAAEPRHDIARTQRAAQPAADLHQQHVAGIVSQRVVDDLEPVEVDEQQRELPLIARGGIDRAAKHAVEHFPVRQVGQAVVRRQILDPLVGPGLFIGAIEILQRERYVVDEPLQQFGKLGRECFLLEGNENHDADHPPLHEQGERAAGIGAIAARSVVERLHAGVGKVIVDDAGLPRTDRPAGEPVSLGARFAGRDTHLQRAGGGWTGGSDDIEEIVIRLHQHDRGGGKLAAFGGCFAHQFEQLRPRSRADDRLVG